MLATDLAWVWAVAARDTGFEGIQSINIQKATRSFDGLLHKLDAR